MQCYCKLQHMLPYFCPCTVGLEFMSWKYCSNIWQTWGSCSVVPLKIFVGWATMHLAPTTIGLYVR